MACGEEAFWNTRDEWWTCWRCGFQWEEGSRGVGWLCEAGKDGQPQLGGWTQVPAWTLPAIAEAPA